ncbi:MAG: AraC family transcriptional regulator [Eubacterium sp.]|nr:AraC family transcriptional regulator [Eubacterium sp.]
MELTKLLQDAVNYIEAHLNENISYEDVARQVYMSGYSFHRTFSLTAGMTVCEYVRSRRLSLAASELQTTDISVIDAALKYGYETPESFSKAFSRFHGVTPKQAKQKGCQLRMFSPLAIKIKLEGGTMNYRMEKRPAEKFLMYAQHFPNEIVGDGYDSTLSDYWDSCIENGVFKQLERVRTTEKWEVYGICTPSEENSPMFEYGIGVAIDDNTDGEILDKLCAEGFRILETAPSECVVLKCFGEDGHCINDMWSRFYREFVPQTGYRQTEAPDFEFYREGGDCFCELWIPVKK